MADSLTQLRDEIAAELQAAEEFSRAPAIVPVSEEAGDIQKLILKALSKVGVSCFVVTPLLERGELARMRRARCRVDLFENVLLNRQGSGFKTAPGLLIATDVRLSGWTPPSGNWSALEFEDHQFDVKGTAVHHTIFFMTDLLT